MFKNTAADLSILIGWGAAVVIMASGVLLAVIALALYPIKAVRALEKRAAHESKNSLV